MKLRIISIVILVALLASACTAQSPAPAPTAVPAAAATAAPTAAPEPVTLTVLADSALGGVYGELAPLFEQENPGVRIAVSYDSSNALVDTLGGGAAADVFASAGSKAMDAAVNSGRVVKYDPKTAASDRLVLAVPAANPKDIKEFKDLALPGVKLSLAADMTPAGKAAADSLERAAKDSENYGDAFKAAVLANAGGPAADAAAVLARLSAGEADAGLLLGTEAAAAGAGLTVLPVPDSLNSVTPYPLAALSDSPRPDLAGRFVSYVLSAEAQAVFAKYGFKPAVTGSTSASSYIVTDALGRAVRFDAPPKRIVMAGKALFMVADAVYLFPGMGERIVALGSTKQGSYAFVPMIDPGFADKVALDSSAGAEEIAAVQPDCVLMKSSNASTLGKALEAVGIPVVYLDFENPEQYQRDLAVLGQLLQDPGQAAKLSAYFTGQETKVTAALSGLTEEQKPRVLVLYYNEKDNTTTINVPPLGWMQTLMVKMAGGTPVWEDANPGKGWTKVNFEQVAAWNPEFIFVVSYFKPVADVVAAYKADPAWQGLDAVKNGHLYAFAGDAYSWDQPDPRWILGLTWMAGKLHPDLFPGLDLTTAAQAFYADLYGMSAEAFQEKIVPIMSGDIH